MAGPVLCVCGAPLLDDVDEKGVLPVGSTDRVAFRRTTDHVICSACLRSYGVRELVARASSPIVIDLLEGMLRRLEEDQGPGPG